MLLETSEYIDAASMARQEAYGIGYAKGVEHGVTEGRNIGFREGYRQALADLKARLLERFGPEQP